MAVPFLSVIVTVYNREKYLVEALESVFAQSRPADEIIVLDDGSTDRSAEVARSFVPQVHVVSQANQGIGGARNTAISLTRGDLIAILDSDDIWAPDKLERQCAAFAEHPELDAVFCRMKPFLSPELVRGVGRAFNESESDALNAPAMMARRKVFLETGPFDTNLRIGEFICWFGRARENGVRFDVLPEVLLHRRIHATNSVHQHADQADYLRVLKRQLDRRRAAPGRSVLTEREGVMVNPAAAPNPARPLF
jgi:glycosyltransferase involved in cell wall biosynthesis